MDSTYETEIINEHGHRVRFNISYDRSTQEVTVFAEGPGSTCEHTWTLMEAQVILKGLSTVFNTPE